MSLFETLYAHTILSKKNTFVSLFCNRDTVRLSGTNEEVRLFSDAEGGEDEVEDVVGGGLAG